jgi:hypothetical protein
MPSVLLRAGTIVTFQSWDEWSESNTLHLLRYEFHKSLAFTEELGYVRCRWDFAGMYINEENWEIKMSLESVSGQTVPYDLMMFSLVGTFCLGQSLLQAFLHCINIKVSCYKVAAEVDNVEAGIDPCWTNQTHTFLAFKHIFWASVRWH